MKGKFLMENVLVTIVLIVVLFNFILSVNKLFQNNKNKQNMLNLVKYQINIELEKFENSFRDELFRNRQELDNNFKITREEQHNIINSFQDSLLKRMNDTVQFQKSQFDTSNEQITKLLKQNEQKLDNVTNVIRENLDKIQKDNSEKLEKMRITVDEKLHKTLEERLGSTFQIVSERLEKVQNGLGEMRQLASGVGDLKRVLTNVKTRGIIGEIQLGNILEQMFSPEQYSQNIKTNKNSNNFVEYAVKLPGKDNNPVWIPIDSKFPIEDYQELLDFDINNPEEYEVLQKKFATKIKLFAKDISTKYISPPDTTNFAIMFLPIEGLYAEVLRNTTLFETLRRDYGIAVTGPTTLAAFLTSLQMGFKTLAIEKRSSEVWELLSAVKTEFGKFGNILAKTKKKLEEASNVIDQADVRTRVIKRKLQNVEELPKDKSVEYLGE